MQLEIEQKFPLENARPLAEKLSALGAMPIGSVEQHDTYYNHPSRDFAQTDEALRIRRTNGGTFLTYKGPKLDTEAKTRREIDLPLSDPDGWPELLLAVGFREVATVRKRRKKFSLERSAFSVEVCLDVVDELGNFAEIEIVAHASQLESAQHAIAELADELDLTNPERRSYLEMLLAKAC